MSHAVPRVTQLMQTPALAVNLQAKVNQAARDVEFEMVNGSFRRKSKRRRWWIPDGGDLACFALGAFAMVVIHALGWWP